MTLKATPTEQLYYEVVDFLSRYHREAWEDWKDYLMNKDKDDDEE